MNIIAIYGSPRKGNTKKKIKRILTKTEELGAKVELVLLCEKRIEFCKGCLSCDSSGKCDIRDDMQIIYPKFESADLIIFGSPNYFSNVSGMMKNFIDRLLPLYYKNKLKDKKAIAVIVGASGESKAIKESINCVKIAADLLNMPLTGDLYLTAREYQDIENNPESIQKIDEFAKNLVL